MFLLSVKYYGAEKYEVDAYREAILNYQKVIYKVLSSIFIIILFIKKYQIIGRV